MSEQKTEREGRYLAGGGDDTRTVGGSNTVTCDGFMTSQSSRLCHFAVAPALVPVTSFNVKEKLVCWAWSWIIAKAQLGLDLVFYF